MQLACVVFFHTFVTIIKKFILLNSMKVLSAILSIYIMVLIAMPCNDVHTVQDNKAPVELSEHNHAHSDHTDLCSPFCFCSCCQTVFIPITFNYNHFTSIIFDLTINYVKQNYIDPATNLWRPPRV